MENALSIIYFISEVALLADTDGSIELLTLRGHYRANFVIVEDVVGGALRAGSIHPSFATKIIIKGS